MEILPLPVKLYTKTYLYKQWIWKGATRPNSTRSLFNNFLICWEGNIGKNSYICSNSPQFWLTKPTNQPDLLVRGLQLKQQAQIIHFWPQPYLMWGAQKSTTLVCLAFPCRGRTANCQNRSSIYKKHNTSILNEVD